VRLVPIYLREAEEGGDMYAQRGLRVWRANCAWLVLDRPDEARRQADAGATPVDAAHPVQLTHYYEMLAHTQIDLYLGDARGAHERVERSWGAIERAMLLRIQSIRLEGWFLRGRAALAAMAAGGARPKLTRLVRAAIRKIEAEQMPWAMPLAGLLEATVAQQTGDAPRAAALLRDAITGLDAADMAMHAAVARRRLGQLIGGGEGRALEEQGAEALRSQAVVAPDKLTEMLAPGWAAAAGAAGS
jgi:hypothetical protein